MVALTAGRPIPGDSTGPVEARLRLALSYVKRGWPLIPVVPGRKEPDTELVKATTGTTSWKSLAREPREQDIRDWFAKRPDVNLAVILGEPSGLVVRDIDTTPETDPIPVPGIVTPTVRTGGGGLHLYARWSVPTKTQILGDGELRGDGGYVVLPPSRIKTGAYSWEIDFEAAEPLALDDLLAQLANLGYPPTSKKDPKEGRPKEGSPRREEKNPNPLSLLGYGYRSLEQGSLRDLLDRARADLHDGDRRRELLRRVDGHAEFVRWIADRVGIPYGELGETFRCVIPGHAERNPSANLWLAREPRIVIYRDHHARTGKENYALAHVYAFALAGAEWQMEQPDLARWKLRALVEMGALDPAPVELPRLPGGAPPDLIRAWEGLRLYFGVRWLTEPAGTPVPFARRFAAHWWGTTSDAASGLIRALRERAVIEKVGELPSGRKNATYLYLPGGGERR